MASDFSDSPIRANLLKEGLFAARFAVVGLLATTTHIAALWVLLHSTALNVLLANGLAFLIAFQVSFTGHYHWTFRTNGNKRSALKKFFAIACVALCGNTIVLALLVKIGFLTPFLSAVASIAIVPFFTFIASRLWGFKS